MNLSRTEARRRSSWRPFLLCGAVVIVAGCVSEHESLLQTEENVAAILTGAEPPDTEARSAVALDAGFRAALLAAVQSSQGYQAAVALEEQAVSRVGVAASVQRPQINANAMLGGRREDGDTVSTDAGAAASLTISQLLYDGGEATAAINQATAEAVAARADRETVANELALEAARAWIDVWQYRARLGLLQARTREMREVLSHIERMAQNGMLDRAMLDDARRQIVSIELEESRLRASLADAQIRFRRFYLVPSAAVERPEDIISMSLARQEAGSWLQAPTLRRLAAELIIARNEVTIAEAAFTPRARLQAGVNSPMDAADPVATSVGITVEYTFSDGGRRRSQLQAAQSRVEAATAQLSETQQTVQAELEAALMQLSELERAMPLLRENIRLSRSSAETARSQIATGQSTLRQVVDAEIDSYRASDQQIAMQAEQMLLKITIASRTGALAREIGLDVQATD